MRSSSSPGRRGRPGCSSGAPAPGRRVRARHGAVARSPPGTACSGGGPLADQGVAAREEGQPPRSVQTSRENLRRAEPRRSCRLWHLSGGAAGCRAARTRTGRCSRTLRDRVVLELPLAGAARRQYGRTARGDHPEPFRAHAASLTCPGARTRSIPCRGTRRGRPRAPTRCWPRGGGRSGQPRKRARSERSARPAGRRAHDHGPERW